MSIEDGGEPPNMRIKLMRRRSATLWKLCAHSLCAGRWADWARPRPSRHRLDLHSAVASQLRPIRPWHELGREALPVAAPPSSCRVHSVDQVSVFI